MQSNEEFKSEEEVETSFISKIKIPITNSICILIALVFYLVDNLLPKIFRSLNWLFILGLVIGVIGIILQVIFTKINKEKPVKIVKTINEYYQVILYALIVIEFVFSLIIFPATVDQRSMVPTLASGDNILVSRSSNIKNNDIIIFEYDNKIQKPNVGVENKELLIKRVIAIPGQSFYYKDNKLFIDGKESIDNFMVEEMNGLSLKEIAKKNNKEDICFKDGKYILPDGWYVVFGDNRVYTGGIPLSIDSRSFGLVHESQIYGIAKYRMNSFFDWDKIR